MEIFETRKSLEVGKRMLRENMRWVRAAVITGPLRELLGAIAIPLLLLYARQQIRLHVMTEGQFFAFLYAMFNAYMPLKRTGYIYQKIQAVSGISAQVFSYLAVPAEKSEQPRRSPRAPFTWSV